METKALEQLHFKYYAEVREAQNVKGRQMLIGPLEGSVLYSLPNFQTVTLGRTAISCFLAQIHVYHVKDSRLVCPLVSISQPLPHEALVVEGGRREVLPFFMESHF